MNKLEKIYYHYTLKKDSRKYRDSFKVTHLSSAATSATSYKEMTAYDFNL